MKNHEVILFIPFIPSWFIILDLTSLIAINECKKSLWQFLHFLHTFMVNFSGNFICTYLGVKKHEGMKNHEVILFIPFIPS